MTPLTVPEARAILVADEALDLSYEGRLASGQTLGFEEREAWRSLVESAADRVVAFVDEKAGYTAKRLTQEDVADLAELLRVSIDDKQLLAWHGRLREIREKMIVRLGDVAEHRRLP